MQLELKKNGVDFQDLIDVFKNSMCNNSKFECPNKGCKVKSALHDQWKKSLILQIIMWLNMPPRDRAESARQIIHEKSLSENTENFHNSFVNNATIPCILKLVRAILKELRSLSIGVWEFVNLVNVFSVWM